MRRNLVAILALLITVSAALLLNIAYSFPDGVAGYSGNPSTHSGAICTNCHSGGTIPVVMLIGPTDVVNGTTNNYTLVISGGQAFGSLDVSVTAGTLSATQDGTQIISGELVQTARRPVNQSGIVTFEFNWTAPATPGNVTMYAAGNSVNGNDSTSGDNANKTKLIIMVQGPTTTNTTTTTTNTTTTLTTNTTTTTTQTNTTTPLANATTVTVTSTVTSPPTTITTTANVTLTTTATTTLTQPGQTTTITTTVTSAPTTVTVTTTVSAPVTTVTTTRTVTQTTTATTTVTQAASTTTSTKTVTSTTTSTRTVTKTTTTTKTIHDHGKTLYKNLCGFCHGLDARGGVVHESVVGASAGEIKEAIQEEHKMKFLKFLSNNAIDEISSYLKSLEDP